MDPIEQKRTQNEKKFAQWTDLPDGGRKYWFEVKGKSGWKARYVKEVDHHEQTTRFLQEIYNETGRLVEVHEKFPIDKGHHKIEE